MTKFCKDCKWCFPMGAIVTDAAHCTHPKSSFTRVNLVTGQAGNYSFACEDMRRKAMDCGPEAQLFEPKEAA